ncbi:phosphohistidine phosphatase [Streptomyces sp. WM6373]|uniref:SixA phosphatase family protein n=1 Tax=Streptomyces TaxID=1883 RepID=UPI0006AEE68B|nr:MULTISPECIES: histidine phosphatase family protein [unclassified Streptomyces]KOU28246.1 phosphohistidine phosphatase [Streptomyces sp. WM6373]KOU69987.1 phosphohistidine phosphatase [Streptomyces sp. XY66]KOU80883.1 phosphohistidine phosphatase [Streptomyces sp. XY58]KOV01702.1 phosphohistidine phosphatase [Streptomyces sp. XY37]KOV28614.1 phosphohistidine phosphatase [Streptomyces sp. H021]
MSSDAGPHTTGCRLLLVRHAKAVPKGDPAEDFERALGERGKADAPRTGRWLAENGYRADLALCSPSRRTRQTWQLLVPALPDPPDAVYDERLYDAAPNTLVTVLTERGAGLGCVALVGHNTGIHELATALCGTGPAELLEQLRDGFPTAGVVVVDLAGGWADLTPGRGHLAAMWSPAH